MAGQGQRRAREVGGGTGGRGRLVVVVESPAKAKTIGAWLGPSCRVMATRGHLRCQSALKFDPRLEWAPGVGQLD